MWISSSFRGTAAAVIALTVASLAAPSLAHAKRFGGSKLAPTSISRTPATAPAAAAKPAAAPTAAAGSGLGSTLGAVVVGGVAGTMVGSALAGSMSPDKDTTKAKEAEAATVEKEAQAARASVG